MILHLLFLGFVGGCCGLVGWFVWNGMQLLLPARNPRPFEAASDSFEQLAQTLAHIGSNSGISSSVLVPAAFTRGRRRGRRPPLEPWRDHYCAQVRRRYIHFPMTVLALELDMAVAARLDEDIFDPDVDGQVPAYLKGKDGCYLVETAREELSEIESLRAENEQLGDDLRRGSQRYAALSQRLDGVMRSLDASESRMRALEPTQGPPGSIRVAVPNRDTVVEVTAMGDSFPRVMSTAFRDVVLTPSDLVDAAEQKLAAEELMKSHVSLIQMGAISDHQAREFQERFRREYAGSQRATPAMLVGPGMEVQFATPACESDCACDRCRADGFVSE